MTDEIVIELLRTLDEPEFSWPSGVDVAGAMAAGRRRRQWWRGGTVFTAVAAIGLAGGGAMVTATSLHEPAPPPSPCAVAQLPIGSYSDGSVQAGDRSGRYLAGHLYPAQDSKVGRVAIWHDGQLRVQQALDTVQFQVTGINAAGTLIADEVEPSTAFGTPKTFVFLNDKPTALLPGFHASATAINDAGVIVGSATRTGNATDKFAYPVRWSSFRATPTRLGMPPKATGGVAQGVDTDGTAIGEVFTNDTVRLGDASQKLSLGYLWRPDGTPRAIPLPAAGGRRAAMFVPYSITNGWVYGDALFGDGGRKAMRYQVTTNRWEPLAADFTTADWLSAADGATAGTFGEDLHSSDPVLAAGSAQTHLPKFRDTWGYQVAALSADGHQVAGFSVSGSPEAGETSHPLRWTCR